jgi:hypothetical protein
MAREFPMRSVQSSRCWFLTTGMILAAINQQFSTGHRRQQLGE